MSHVNQGFTDELDRMVAKHEEARRARGVEMSRDLWLKWAASLMVRSGNRREAVQTYVHLVRRYRDLKSLARALLGGLFPELMVRYWGRNSLRRLPPGWRDEAEAWLAAIRDDGTQPAGDAPRTAALAVR
jgi:hypothetical protein